MDHAKVLESLNRLRAADPELGRELENELARPPRLERFAEGVARGETEEPLTQETIVLRTGRPVLAIANDQASLVFTDADSQVWRQRLSAAAPLLTPAIRAVGRVEVEGHPQLDWLGTGWLVAPDIIVTNRHVANEFGRASGTSFVFRRGLFRRMRANLDFLEEAGRSAERVARVTSILHIEGPNGPDVAFLKLQGATNLTAPIGLATGPAAAQQQVAVIGYPARDSRIPDQALMERIFGNLYDKKRLAPGQVQPASDSTHLLHDCSTLGGNSGSVVLDLATGKAAGLHFAGRFLESNFAVPAAVIAERLAATERGEAAGRTISIPNPAPAAVAQSSAGGTEFTCTIPIQLTISVGSPQPVVKAMTPAPAPAQEPDDDDDIDNGDDDLVVATEAVPADYLNRQGYLADFLGADAPEIPLPKIITNASQIVKFNFNGNANETVLRYEHFSVVMRKDRRMCFFSAVNIDGTQPKKEKRPGWRFDPRIPESLQIRNECYGNPPRFARGHMTRREDPMWGSMAIASRANADSMHVTNAVPQMQTFNGTVWLELEEYALQNARRDDMKVCVFTGPVLKPSDPVKFQVKVPVTFWKVIAFIHDETGELSATGYTMSQKNFLEGNEFVFGAFETHQRSLASIEQLTGLSFGPLTALDLFEEEAIEQPLTRLSQIRFR